MSIRKAIAKAISPIKEPEVHSFFEPITETSAGCQVYIIEEPEQDMLDVLDDWMTGKIDTF